MKIWGLENRFPLKYFLGQVYYKTRSEIHLIRLQRGTTNIQGNFFQSLIPLARRIDRNIVMFRSILRANGMESLRKIIKTYEPISKYQRHYIV
jgi:hypothetical protein